MIYPSAFSSEQFGWLVGWLVESRGLRDADRTLFVADQELDWLTPAPMAPAGESHPYPRNVEDDYNGRLLAKFLLSFLDSRFISGD